MATAVGLCSKPNTVEFRLLWMTRICGFSRVSGITYNIYPRSAHRDAPLIEVVFLFLLLLPLHPLVSDDQEIGESGGFQERDAPCVFTRTHNGNWPLWNNCSGLQ